MGCSGCGVQGDERGTQGSRAVSLPEDADGTRDGRAGGEVLFRGMLAGQERCSEMDPPQGNAGGQEGAVGSPPRSLTSQVLARGVILVMDPLRRRRVEVGLGGGEAQGVVAGPHRQADVEGVRGDDAILVHQPPRGQLQGESRSRHEQGTGHSVVPSPVVPAPSPHT